MSSSAIDKYLELKKQVELRDQDIQNVYMYNDFTAYGVNEVVDNWVAFNREVSRRSKTPYTVWAELEAVSWFLQLDYINIWFSKSFSLFLVSNFVLICISFQAAMTATDLLKHLPL